MLDLSSGNGDTADFNEIRRLIYRQKLMLGLFDNPQKAILGRDFYRAVNLPDQSVADLSFSKFFGLHAKRIKINMGKLLRSGGGKSKLIFYADLDKETKVYLRNDVATYIDERMLLAKQSNIKVSLFDGYVPANVGVLSEISSVSGNDREEIIDEFVQMFSMPAYRLKDFIKAMDAPYHFLPSSMRRIASYENFSIKQGRGSEALRVWEAVGKCTDYSEHFPSNDCGAGGKGGRIKVGGFKPQFT